jgi:hypothetical protein
MTNWLLIGGIHVLQTYLVHKATHPTRGVLVTERMSFSFKGMSKDLYIIVFIHVEFQEEEIKMATQLAGAAVMPIRQSVRREKARAITADEKRYNPYVALRTARANKRLQGKTNNIRITYHFSLHFLIILYLMVKPWLKPPH